MTSKAYAVLDGKREIDDWTEDTVPRTYKVNRDCTGKAENTGFPPIKFHLVVVDHGEKFFLVFDGGTSPGDGPATTGVAEKIH
jgi:hypothetical protein